MQFGSGCDLIAAGDLAYLKAAAAFRKVGCQLFNGSSDRIPFFAEDLSQQLCRYRLVRNEYQRFDNGHEIGGRA